MIRKFFSRYRVEAAFATAVIILLAAGFLAHRTMVASGENERQVLHTYEVINTLDQLSAALAVVDSASRSFALTGDDPFLRVQEAAALSARRHLSALRRFRPIMRNSNLGYVVLSKLQIRISLFRVRLSPFAVPKVWTRPSLQFDQE